MSFKLEIFDLDGTILNTIDDLSCSVNYALSKSNLPHRSLQEVQSFVGNGIRLLIERAVPRGTPVSITDIVFSDFCDYYKLHCADKTKPYEGILEMLKNLKENNIKIAVVSNKADFAVQELCARYFDNMFDIVMGEKKGINKKPSPDEVNKVLEILNEDKKNTVYIGDSEVDIQTSKNANVNCISVDWGFKSHQFLLQNGASKIVSNPKELLNEILK
jgi:phosphoglycolate phosphatase